MSLYRPAMPLVRILFSGAGVLARKMVGMTYCADPNARQDDVKILLRATLPEPSRICDTNPQDYAPP